MRDRPEGSAPRRIRRSAGDRPGYGDGGSGGGHGSPATDEGRPIEGTATRSWLGAEVLADVERVLATIPVAFIATDVRGTVTHWSTHAVDLYGWTEDEARGRPIGELTVGPLQAAVADDVMRQVGAGRPWEGEFTARTRSGGTVDVHVLDLPVRDADGAVVGVAGFSFDVTSERDDLEAEADAIARLAAAAERVREEERARIARELHDELGQYLTMVRTELLGIAGPGVGSDAVARLVGLADGGIDAIHRIIADLAPADLGPQGLDAALEELARGYGDRTGQRVTIDLDRVPVTDANARTLYRVAQACLTNCERHAHARRVEVRLRSLDGHVALSVRDDGVGIPDDADGFGLTSMRVRAAEAGGTLTVARHPDGGTEAVLLLPDGGGAR